MSQTLVCEEPGFDSQHRQEGYSLFHTVRTVSGSTQHPIERVPGALTPGVKRPESGTNVHSIGEVNDACS